MYGTSWHRKVSWGSRIASVSVGPRVGRDRRGTKDSFVTEVTPGVVLSSLVWTICSSVRLVPPFLVPSLHNERCQKETRSGPRTRP